MNSKNVYVLIKSSKENYYKTLVSAKRKNENAPENSINSSPPRIFAKKSLLKLVLVHPLKRKTQMQQKTLKTLLLVKVINGITNKNSGPHKSQ